MIWNDLRNVLNKVNEKIVKSKVFAIQMGNRIHKRAVLASICILLVVILGTVISGITVAYADSINGVGVEIYWDQACTKRTHSLDWGIIEPGTNSTVTVYVKNEDDSAVLSETQGNFAVSNSSVSEVKLKLKDTGNQSNLREFEIEIKSSSGNYKFRMDENKDYVKHLKQVYGDRVKTPMGYFGGGLHIKIG